MNWRWIEDELKIDWKWIEDELKMNWKWIEDELKKNWRWIEDELKINGTQIEDELMMTWKWIEDELMVKKPVRQQSRRGDEWGPQLRSFHPQKPPPSQFAKPDPSQKGENKKPFTFTDI